MVGESAGSSWLARLVVALTSVGESAGEALVYSSAYLAAITVVEVAIVMQLLSLPVSLAPVVGGLVTFAVYANDRVADVEDDALTRPRQAAFVRSHRDRLYTLAALAYGLAVAISVLGGPLALALTLLPGAFWVVYAQEWIPASVLPIRRLKEVFLLNTAVVASAWAISLTFLPLAFADGAVTGTTVFVLSYFFLRSFVDTEIPNILDVEGDRAIGVKTLPSVVGADTTRALMVGLDLLTAAVIAYGVRIDLVTGWAAATLGVGIAYSVGVTCLVGRLDDDLVSIAVEFEYVVVAIAFVIGFVGL